MGWMVAVLVGPAEGALALEWEAPLECPTGVSVRRRILARLPADVPAVDVVGRVQVADAHASLTLRVRVGDRIESRTIDTASCDELADAAALITAVLVQEERIASAAPQAHADDASPPPDAATTPIDAPRSAATRPIAAAPRMRVRPGLRVAGGIEAGALPGLGADFEIAGTIDVGRARLELAIHDAPPRTKDFTAGAGGGRLGLVAAASFGCGVPASGAWAWPICAGVEAGAMHGRGRGLARERSDRVAWVAVAAKAGIARRVHRAVWLTLNAGAWIAVVQPGFATDDRELYRAARLSGRVLVGVEVRRP